MLKVTGCKEGSLAEIQFGEYVIADVVFEGERHPAAPLYWRVGDFAESLLEIGINRVSGAVAKVCLVACGEREVLQDHRQYLAGSSISGIPVFDIAGWPDSRYKDEVGYLEVAESEAVLVMFFSSDKVVELVYEFSGVRFGVAFGGRLIWIAVDKSK
ncbi:hypothetical protein [Pseudomonas sp. 91RF]|jgi:hypothetical protein|uniref:hypothetical protein n=1 Tax=Pseudomonas sp. 91RF TaxID=2292261 RepID=UPI0011C39CBE|nr:hypothetical protein [Pseudomonas sp. 91RF]